MQTQKKELTITAKTSVLVLAAGLGTRLGKLTANRPKALVEVAGKTLLELLLVKLKNIGFKHIIVNIHHHGDQIIDFIEKHNNFGLNISISDERKQLMDTGGGILQALQFVPVGNSLLVHNVDIYSDLDLLEFIKNHKKSGAAASLAVRERESSRKLLFGHDKSLCGWMNTQNGQTKTVSGKSIVNADAYAFSGISVIEPDSFRDRFEIRSCSLIDLLLELAASEKVLGCPEQSGEWIDVGKPEQLEALEKILRQKTA